MARNPSTPGAKPSDLLERIFNEIPWLVRSAGMNQESLPGKKRREFIVLATRRQANRFPSEKIPCDPVAFS
jgi:hypothetical protein